MPRKQVVLSEKHIEKVEFEADRSGINFSEMLRRIIDWFFDDDDFSEKESGV